MQSSGKWRDSGTRFKFSALYLHLKRVIKHKRLAVSYRSLFRILVVISFSICFFIFLINAFFVQSHQNSVILAADNVSEEISNLVANPTHAIRILIENEPKSQSILKLYQSLSFRSLDEQSETYSSIKNRISSTPFQLKSIEIGLPFINNRVPTKKSSAFNDPSASILAFKQKPNVVTSRTDRNRIVYTRLNLSMANLCSVISAILDDDLLYTTLSHLEVVTQSSKSVSKDACWNALVSELRIKAVQQNSASVMIDQVTVGLNLKNDSTRNPRSIYYSILSGAKTIERRASAALNTWVQLLDKDRVCFITSLTDSNMKSSDQEHPEQSLINRFPGSCVRKISPLHPENERNLLKMNSWSHLVRIRDAWDSMMLQNPDIQLLALIDDDTYVFPQALVDNSLRVFPKDDSDGSQLIAAWGGYQEFIRVDNVATKERWEVDPDQILEKREDDHQLAKWLRDLNVQLGGEWCSLPGESGYNDVDVTKQCKDVHCKRCPLIPQGGTVILTRTLVKRLRPVLDKCETKTQSLCSNCGSQRLYMCIYMMFPDTPCVHIPGIRRATLKKQPISGIHEDSEDSSSSTVSSIHGFEKGLSSSITGSIEGDFNELFCQELISIHRTSFTGNKSLVTFSDILHTYTTHDRSKLSQICQDLIQSIIITN